jgi:hypothetical protein
MWYAAARLAQLGLAHHHVVVHEALASPCTPVNLSEDMPPSRNTFSSLSFDPGGHHYTRLLRQAGPIGNTPHESRIRAW